MPRLVNSGTWSVISRKPVPAAPVARLPGQLRPLAGDALEPSEELVEEVGGLLQAPAMQLQAADARPCPSVGCAPQSWPFSSYWIGS